MLAGVTFENIMAVWPRVAPMLQRALDKSQHDMDIEDVFSSLRLRDMQLWVWVVDKEIKAAAVTQIINHPQRTICTIPLIGGSCMRDWLKVEDTIAAWAKEKGCTQLEGYARPGWLRVLKNWKAVWTTMRRDL
jgi:hypothetical protein